MSIALLASTENNFSVMDIEIGLTAIAFAAAFAWPGSGSSWFLRVERLFRRLAHRRGLAVLTVGLAALFLRVAILPIHPIPVPFRPDDFSNLLAADTFAHGRLTNPTPAMWVHFESIHIDMKPTYMSMYFPAQGLVLAAGKVLFGQPWFGVLISGAFMCAGLCWMLQAWLPSSWALLGGFLAVLRLALFSYWTNAYDNGGPIAALGGALLLGALPRFMRDARPRYALLMAAGVVLLALTRPFEGVLLCIPVAVALVRWLVVAKNRPSAPALFRLAAPALALLIAAAAWLGYYDARVFGNSLTLPYTINRATYATAPYFVWQKPRPEPVYHHDEMRRFYQVDELEYYNQVHSSPGLATMTLFKAIMGILFLTGAALLPPLFMLPWALRDHRIRLLVLCLVVLAVGMTIEVYLFPHHLAPFTGAFYAVGLQCMRHLRVWSPGGKSVGLAMTRLSVAICVLMAGLRPFDRQLHCAVPARPVSTWICNWYGPDLFSSDRTSVLSELQQDPGQQLAIVRYSPTHDPLDEWVYNAADIDNSKVIWARDMDPAANRELIEHYSHRKVWLVQPDQPQAKIVPYPVPEQVTAASR
jgi:hypothetical protein